MRRTTLATLAAAVSAACIVPAAAGTSTAAESTATTATTATTLSTLRAETVQRAKNLLANPQDYKAVQGGVTRQSVPDGARNYLEWEGSNANRNEFNDFNGLDWCGYFIARAWTGQNTPDPASFPRLPTSYASSQAWRTDSGSRYHRFDVAVLPGPGDVLVWQNGPGNPGQVTSVATGHVGVVIAVDATTKTVTTVEGNVNGDEIARRSYAWDANGPTLPDKHFLGFTARE